MSTFITVLILIVALALILIVLVQNSKGGGLAAGFSSSNQIMGAPKTADFLEKATWTLAGVLFVLCVVAAVLPSNKSVENESVLKNSIEQSAKVDPMQATPGTEAPAAPIEIPAAAAPVETPAAPAQ